MKALIAKFSCLLGLMFLLTACPYQSKVAIGPAEEKVDKKLFGEWIAVADLEYENPTYYSIEKFSKVKYTVVENSYSSYDSTYTETKYFMHSTTIKDRTFLNIQEYAGGDYYLHYVEVGDKEFTLFEISENIDEQFMSSEELKKFVTNNMNLSFFYTKGEIKYIRKT